MAPAHTSFPPPPPHRGILFSRRKKKILLFVTTWMDFEGLMLSEMADDR